MNASGLSEGGVIGGFLFIFIIVSTLPGRTGTFRRRGQWLLSHFSSLRFCGEVFKKHTQKFGYVNSPVAHDTFGLFHNFPLGEKYMSDK